MAAKTQELEKLKASQKSALVKHKKEIAAKDHEINTLNEKLAEVNDFNQQWEIAYNELTQANSHKEQDQGEELSKLREGTELLKNQIKVKDSKVKSLESKLLGL